MTRLLAIWVGGFNDVCEYKQFIEQTHYYFPSACLDTLGLNTKYRINWTTKQQHLQFWKIVTWNLKCNQ